VLILLPPSEGKADTAAGQPFRLERLSNPSLNPSRERVMTALVKLCGGRDKRAREVLGLSERQNDELDRNRDLLGANALPAAQVYTGVLYGALDHSTLSAAVRRRVDDSVLVWSALWGVVRLDDVIPAYRLSGDVTLPRLGSLATFWRRPLQKAMDDRVGNQVVLDLRSGVYAKMWTPSQDLAGRTVTGRVLQSRPDGSRVVVSHHNKATKGRLVRRLATARTRPRTAEALAAAVESAGYVTELHQGKPGRPWSLDIVVDEV
jgi:cytoplasmic iron level regulating protein YaaA (DUF328/UPF0246 family)